uniref:Uncharacterized protein n=1 Tax=Rhizophora mucronata TaxID=61149 RepID=A0A2P2IY43_RHIMU
MFGNCISTYSDSEFGVATKPSKQREIRRSDKRASIRY